jgi:hypothetical protein
MRLGRLAPSGWAEKKATFDEILKHYYRGIELVSMCTNPAGCALWL